MYMHLDRTIGELLDRLDTLVGHEDYVVALSADHGVAEIPEQAVKEGKDAGRLTAAAVIDPAEKRAQAALGSGKYIARLSGNDLYFEDGMYAKLAASPAALEAVIGTVAATPGIARVFRSEQVRDGATSKDPARRAAALSYFPGRSGDLIIALKPGWMFGPTGTTHSSVVAPPTFSARSAASASSRLTPCLTGWGSFVSKPLAANSVRFV